ncbi:putative clathrin assembly protein At2g25430 [Magnolia sinica]|uniref:putative clathrin assembly protein At2g25430 n=1 Tax=Magnolia sinica TaxID=86752 RepID=UPI00265B2E44|nr:putative clathrin assembly protein At2g25430 [Magnolia sinica]
MHRRFRQAYTALREHGSVSYAKIASISGFYDLDFIIIKATAPDDVPLPERYVQELVKIFTFSPSSSRAFSICFTRRFGKTQCWRVAFKCLLLLHRLLRSLPESNSFRSDLLWSRSNGFLSLYPCHFRDASSSPSNSRDFTHFIRSYARLLDEALECFSIDDHTANEFPESLSEKMREIGRVVDLLPQLQSLLDRVIECHPVGAAARSFIIRSAMKPIIRDSFMCYAVFRHNIVVLLDNLFQMQYRCSISALRIYKKAATQARRLSEFYESCKAMGLCGAYEYPFVDQIPHIHVRALESFINEMWQLTESSSSTSRTSLSETESPPSSFTEDGSERQLARLETVVSTEWEKFEEEEVGPLIQLEGNDVDWEVLLEASAARSWVPHNLLHQPVGYGFGYGIGYGYGCRTMEGREQNVTDTWQLQPYNLNPFDPFYYGYGTPNCYEVSMGTYAHPWRL